MIYYYLLSLAVLAIDQITKVWIRTSMELNEQISVLGNFFLITSHRNRGAAFGIFQDQRIFFIIITLPIVAGIIVYLTRMRVTGSVWLKSGLAMILGGALGNFWDRLYFKEVTDFLQFNFGSHTFPIFNVADMAIVIGAFFMILDSFFHGYGVKKETRV